MADPEHLAFPPRIAPDGQLATVPQDTLARARQDVLCVARTEQGTRTGRDNYGVPDTTFTPGTDPAALEQLLEQHVPDADVTITEPERDTPLEQVLTIDTALASA